jgi:hypothetical protein
METIGIITGLVLVGVALVAGQCKPTLQPVKQRSSSKRRPNR